MKKLAMLLALCILAASLPLSALAEELQSAPSEAQAAQAAGETGALGLIAVPDDEDWAGFDAGDDWPEEEVVSQPEEWAVSAQPEEETAVSPEAAQGADASDPAQEPEAGQEGTEGQESAEPQPPVEYPADPENPHIDPAGPQLATNDVTLGVGETFDLKPVMPEGKEGAILCTVNDETVATVTGEGVLQAVAKGVAVVTAAGDDGAYTQCVVRVKKAPDQVSFSEKTLLLGLGEQTDVLKVAVGSKEGKYAGAYTITSSKPKKVKVCEDGSIEGLKAGKSTLTVTTYNGKTDTCKVEVVDAPTKLTAKVDKKTIGVGETAQITVKLPEGSASQIKYKSENKDVLTVDKATGTITGVAPGTTRVRVRTFNKLTKYITIHVLPAPETLSFENASVKLGVGMELACVAAVNDGAAGNITYKVKKTSVATYKDGTLKGVKKGATVLTAKTYNGLTAKCEIKVVAAPKSVKLAYSKLTVGVGQKVQLKPDVGSSASTYTYSSSNKKVATVSKKGVVKGVKKGTATITVKTYNKKTFKLKVTVKKAPGSISLKPKSVNLGIGETADVSFTLPKNTAADVSFSIADKSVAKLKSGKLTGLAPGETTMTVTTHNGKTATTKIKVWPKPEWIEPDTSLLELLEGEKHELEIDFSPGTRSQLSFTSDDKKVAKVSSAGVITAVGGGKTTIHVGTNDPDVGCDISVTVWPAPTKVAFKKTAIEVDVNETAKLKPVIPDGSKTTYTYTSSDEDVVEVSKDGVITGISRGKATVTVKTHNGKKATAKITVVDPWYPVSASLENAPEYLKADSTYQLSFKLKPETAIPDFEWSTTDKSVAWVDEDDVIHTSGFGYAVLSAVSRKNKDITLKFTLAVETDNVTLAIPARTTNVAGIKNNLAMIEAIHTSAINQLKAMYSGGVISKDDASKRKSMVDNAFKDYAFPWMTPSYQDYWKAANSEGGVKDFKPDRVYYGIPYISTGRNREYNAAKALKENRFTDSGKGYYLMNQKNLLNGKYCGNDCSCFVEAAIWGTNSSHSNERTCDIATSSAYKTISGFKNMRTGDLICKGYSHVVMFLYYVNADKSQIMIIENGGIEPGTNTVHCMVMDVKWYDNKGYKVRRLRSLS